MPSVLSRRGEPSGNTVPSTVRAPSSVLSERAIESLKCVRPRRTSVTPKARSWAICAALMRLAFCDRKRLSTPLSGRVANERGVALAEVSRIGNLQAHGAALRGLRRKRAEPLGQLQERLQLAVLLGADGRHVDRRQHHAVLEKVAHLLGDADADLLLRLGGGAADVRRGHDVFPSEQRRSVRRLSLEYVKRGSGHFAGRQRVVERLAVDQLAAGAVDDAHAVFHLGDRLGPDQLARFGLQGKVQRDVVGAGVKLVDVQQLYVGVRCGVARNIRVVGDDLHAERLGAPGHLAADVAEADDAQGSCPPVRCPGIFASPICPLSSRRWRRARSAPARG